MSKIAFLYPGQGAQKVGMGLDFYNTCASARSVYDKANEVLDIDVKALCFEENDELHITEYTQAALVTTCLAMTSVVEEAGIRPDVTAGLSLGEYCAVSVAGAMNIVDAIKIVRKRGILMERSIPTGEGGMAAVLGMTGDEIEAIIEPIDGVSIANYNCPGQIVITGVIGAVEAAEEKLKEAGAKRVIRLNVSGPFHSKMLEKAGIALGAELERVSVSKLHLPYVTNVTGDYVTESSEIKTLLSLQVSSSVRWEQSIRTMIANGVDTFIEIGPGKTLAGFMKKIDKNVKMYNIETLADIDKVKAALKQDKEAE